MHQGNRDWLKSVREKYPEHFKDAQVLEIGSYNVNGTARDYFKDAKRYVGVDCCKGKCVDIVCKATETKFKPGEFDTLVYLSVFEHDPISGWGTLCSPEIYESVFNKLFFLGMADIRFFKPVIMSTGIYQLWVVLGDIPGRPSSSADSP